MYFYENFKKLVEQKKNWQIAVFTIFVYVCWLCWAEAAAPRSTVHTALVGPTYLIDLIFLRKRCALFWLAKPRGPKSNLSQSELVPQNWLYNWLSLYMVSYKHSLFTSSLPVHHAKKFLKSIHTEALFLNCFLKTLSSYFRILTGFSKIFLSQIITNG